MTAKKNWHTWSKEAESYLTLEELWDVVDPDKDVPTSAAAFTCDRKVYANIYCLIKFDCRDSIIETKSGHRAWALLKTVSIILGNVCRDFTTRETEH